jgi:hypothetical protein
MNTSTKGTTLTEMTTLTEIATLTEMTTFTEVTTFTETTTLIEGIYLGWSLENGPVRIYLICIFSKSVLRVESKYKISTSCKCLSKS